MKIYIELLKLQEKNILFRDFLNQILDFIQVISNKYLLLSFFVCIYFSYSFINDKISLTSYTSDNYNDYILNTFTNRVLNISKFSIHIVNNKILHPINLFLQNL